MNTDNIDFLMDDLRNLFQTLDSEIFNFKRNNMVAGRRARVACVSIRDKLKELREEIRVIQHDNNYLK